MKVEIGPYPDYDAKQYELFEELLVVNNRHVHVEIDDYDVWNMDSTLALIVLPMLKKLKENKHGAPFVKLEDVPEHLHPTEPVKEYETDDKHFDRWDWVLDEMIFAFESKTFDWEDQFWDPKPEIDWERLMKKEVDESGYVPTPWKVEGKLDEEGRIAYQARISNGFRLFGVYYEGLWD